MKKIIIISGIILSLFTQAYAYNYDDNFKKEFYDNLENGLFVSLKKSLSSNGYSEESINAYLKVMKSRLNRTELENKTWGCISKHSMEEMVNTSSIVNECFGDWSSSFIYGNSDAIQLLQR